MNIYKSLFFLLLFTSCSFRPLMSPDDFESIPIGCDIEAVEDQYGAPFDVCSLENGTEEYRYVMRFNVNSDIIEQREFLFKVRNGKIVDKRYSQSSAAFQQQIH